MSWGRPVVAEGVGAALLLLALPGAWLDARSFYACWLAAWWFVAGLMLGSMVHVWIHRLSGGRWGEVLRPAGLLAARRMPVAVLLLLPLAAGLRPLYPWAADPGWAARLSQPAFAEWWLRPGFFAARLAFYALAWCWLSRPATASSSGRAAASLLVYGLSGTLAAVDLLMSLVPGWFSTAFGLVVLSGQALGGCALMTVVLAWRSPSSLAAPARGEAPVGRDLGNLLLMWTMTWAYLAFMEFLIIWAENLPAEIAWYVPRLQTGWFAAGVALVVLQLALPMLALLQRRLKDRPKPLAAIAALLLATQCLDCAWLVLPSVEPHSLAAAWRLPLIAGGMGLLLFARLPAELSRRAQVVQGPGAGHVHA